MKIKPNNTLVCCSLMHRFCTLEEAQEYLEKHAKENDKKKNEK